jgi:hypothetical protein
MLRVTGAVLSLAVALAAQDVPADRILLSRVLQHVGDDLKLQRDVSCLETISRAFKPANGKLKPLDTVQLEVLTTGHKELYASPGARNFSENPPSDFVGSGAIGDGFFGLYLAKLVNGKVSFTWKGFEESGGRRLARWDYEVPLDFSGQSFVLQEGSGAVSLHGSFWASPDTFSIVRLAVAIGDIPATLPLAFSAWVIDYAPATVARDLTVLLPQTAEFEMTKLSGESSHSQMAFTQCRTFAAESSLNFNEAGPAQFAASSVDDTLRPLPAGIEIPVKLTTRLTGDMTVGALIDGVVEKNIVQKGQRLIPAGSSVRGRIRRLERYSEPKPYFTVAIEYTELTIDGIRYRFDAALSRIDAGGNVSTALAASGRGLRESIHFVALPGVATFFFSGVRLDLPAGLETVWTTVKRR